MHPKRSTHTVSLMALPLLFLPVVLTGQNAHEDAVPLKNWATPLYWQPNQAEKETGVGVTPKIHFSSNQLSTAALTFVAITPCRLVDTRGAGGGFTGPAPFSGPSIAPSTSVNFPVQAAAEATITAPAPCGTIPSVAQAYSFNVTAVDKSGAGGFYLSVYPTGSPASVVTIVDYQATPGVTLANAAIVPAGTPYGGITVFDSGPTATVDVIIDMNGFYAAPTDLSENTAVGAGALFNNTTGNNNTASGEGALQNNITGSNNVASGMFALGNNTNGGNNIAIGTDAAGNVSGGNSNNIHIGSLGASGDSSTIRIGATNQIDGYTQTSFFASGIYGVNLGGSAVSITASGQLSSPSSSRRYKEDISDMGDTSRGLMDLRPVTFRYKKAFENGSKPLQYGLIAEEVADVYPDLVVYKDGQPDAVQYQTLPAMLLNEVQKQDQHAQQQDETIRQQQEQIRKLEARLAALEALLPGKAPATAAAGR